MIYRHIQVSGKYFNIFLSFFLYIANLIQAGRDGNKARSVIFYLIKEELRIKFGILAKIGMNCLNKFSNSISASCIKIICLFK
jgi:hypothetical protein